MGEYTAWEIVVIAILLAIIFGAWRLPALLYHLIRLQSNRRPSSSSKDEGDLA